jgi:uncharacterized membrane protein
MESLIERLLHSLRLALEGAAAVSIAVGFVNTVVRLLADHFNRRIAATQREIRLTFSRYLSLALEFQLAADIVSTTIAPTYDDLATLAIVATIRTGLNFFLSREIREAHEAPVHLQLPIRGDASFPTDARPAKV